MKKNSDEVRQYLEDGATIYMCGGMGMGKDVLKVIDEIWSDKGGIV